MAKTTIGIGHRFRDIQMGQFGNARSEWIVRALYTGRDNIEYANLILASDATEQKTLALSILRDPKRFLSYPE